MLSCFNQLREGDNGHEPNFGLRCLRHHISLKDDFEYTIFLRFKALIDTHVTNFGEKIDLPISSLSNTLSETRNPKDIIDDLLIKPDPLIPFAWLHKFEEGEESNGVLVLMLIKDSGIRKFLSMMILES